MTFILNFGDFDTNFGGTVVYNKKKRRFTHINYSDKRNWQVSFSIESKCYYSAYENYQMFKNIFPFGASNKKITNYLLNN